MLKPREPRIASLLMHACISCNRLDTYLPRTICNILWLGLFLFVTFTIANMTNLDVANDSKTKTNWNRIPFGFSVIPGGLQAFFCIQVSVPVQWSSRLLLLPHNGFLRCCCCCECIHCRWVYRLVIW